jgi:hypothetical protein
LSVARVGLGVSARREYGREKPRRRRLGLLLLASLGAGGAAGIAAFIVIWLPTLFGVFYAPSTQPQISADTIFPPAQAIQQTIDVVDPPVYRAPAPTHSGDDGGGGGGGGDD